CRKSGASPCDWRSDKSSPPTSSHGHSGGAPTKPPHNKPTSDHECNC
ncbi:MAG: hypothetical protein AVDCRST_MAG51-2152, partial [uncultured Ramlibacter sp.]